MYDMTIAHGARSGTAPLYAYYCSESETAATQGKCVEQEYCLEDLQNLLYRTTSLPYMYDTWNSDPLDRPKSLLQYYSTEYYTGEYHSVIIHDDPGQLFDSSMKIQVDQRTEIKKTMFSSCRDCP